MFDNHHNYTDYEEEMNSSSYNPTIVQTAFSALMRKVYLWMTFALVVTGLTALVASGNQQFMYAIMSSRGLFLGLIIAAVALVITVIYYLIRRVIPFKEIAASIPEGFKSMVPAILILTFAWTLKAMTDSLGAKQFVEALVKGSAGGFQAFLPAIVFLIAVGLSFATGTSWGTFGILIPITLGVFPLTDPLGVVCVSACMAGAVCGDHCSPISDTTIMSSAGAQCEHVNHVSTQMPYAFLVAGISFVTYIAAGFIRNWAVSLIVGLIITGVVLLLLKFVNSDNEA